ncbi:enolase C-terminal domain-like protein [Cupriavidus sp. amp6]|uniref:enolase C-terminal domain-like protein n=1 Tax=Cupriavidus sp. amp6 TaxID=388051 RepID=UPI0003FA0B97
MALWDVRGKLCNQPLYKLLGGSSKPIPAYAGGIALGYLDEGAVQVFQPDLSKTGGITEAMRIAALVSAWGYKVHPHSSATGINHAACVHYLAAVDNPGYFEACVSHYNPFRDMFGPGFQTDATGCVVPLEKPGLGLDVDESVFEEFAFIDGPGYVVKF